MWHDPKEDDSFNGPASTLSFCFHFGVVYKWRRYLWGGCQGFCDESTKKEWSCWMGSPIMFKIVWRHLWTTPLSINIWIFINKFPAVNFISVFRELFSYECRFGSFFLRTYVEKKLPKQHSYEKSTRKTLMKLTPDQINIFYRSLSSLEFFSWSSALTLTWT